ncbi:golgin subfamily A member 4 isoform X2 [Cotesia glomerata]|uniref:golgin subfamily A member 4 isoform X2 n=1 Tax=Cotesia glomerata TaxID=32391 RepID=UPI001D006DFA|nr:golgin subfamily A member 4 isoform X2 [Cotesia glomerata]
MFKKFKDKLTEEMKQSPARFQAGMQHLAQAVSPGISNLSLTGSGDQASFKNSNDNFSLTDTDDLVTLTDDRAVKNNNSPRENLNFQNIDLTSLSSSSLLSNNTTGLSRSSSVNSVTSNDTQSGLFPIFESPGNIYQLQSDMDQSASEADDTVTNHQFDELSKEEIYSAYRKSLKKYHKYRGRFTDLVNHYREMERIKVKLETLLVETQNKALRRIGNLKEQCTLEQQAKAHLEEALRNDMEEKDHIIDTLNTKIKLLQANGSKIDLMQLENDPVDKNENESNSTDQSEVELLKQQHQQLSAENGSLKNKVEKFETLVAKYKETLKKSKEKIGELEQEKFTLERDFESIQNSNYEKIKSLEESLVIKNDEIANLQSQVTAIRLREEESAISLAENKLAIHREMEIKEEQIKQLTEKLKDLPVVAVKNTQEFSVQTDEVVDPNDKIIEEFKLKLDNTQKEIVALQTELSNCNSIITEINNKNVSYENMISSLNNDKKLISNYIINCRENIDSFKSEQFKLKQQFVTDYKNIIDNNMSSVSQSILEMISNCGEREIEERNKIKEEFEAKYNELKQETDKLYSEIEQVNFELFDYQKLCGEKQKKLEELEESKLINEKNCNEDSSKEIEGLNKLIEELREEIVFLNEKSQEKQEQQLECIAHNDCIDIIDIKNKFEALMDIISAKNDFIESLKSKYREVLCKDEIKCKKCSDIKVNDLEMLMDIIYTKNDFIEQLRCRVRDNCSVIDTLNDNINDLCERNRVIGEEDNSLKIQLADLEKILSELRSENVNLAEENENLKSSDDDRGERIRELGRELIDLRNQNEELKIVIGGLEERVGEKDVLVLRLEEIEKEKALVEENVKKLVNHNESLKKSLEEVNDNLRATYEEIKKCKGVISALEVQSQKYKEDIKERDEKIEAQAEEIQTNLKLVKHKKEEINKLSEEVERRNEEITKRDDIITKRDEEIRIRDEEITTRDEEITTRDEEITKRDDEVTKRDEEINKYNEEKTDLLIKIDELQHLLKEHSNEKVELKVQIDELNKLNKSYEDKIKAFEKKIKEIEESANNNNSVELENLKKLVKELEIKLNDAEVKLQDAERTVTNYKTNEAQIENINTDLKDEMDKLKDQLAMGEEEQRVRMKQLVKEFQARLDDKDLELQAALDQKFDRQKNYESDLIQQYKEQLKDFQIELTAKSEEIESLRSEQHLLVDAKSKHHDEVSRLQETIDKLRNDADQMKDKHIQEKNKIIEENKKIHTENTLSNSTTDSLHHMQNTLVAQRRELSELRKLVKLRCETSSTLEDSTEIEYLRNILYEYMMGKETLVLARVIAAVVKFDQEQTHKVLEKEKDKLTLLGSLGLTL